MPTTSEGLLLDTHAWIWLQEGDKGMGRETIRLVEEARDRNRLFASAISVWELGNLDQADRIQLSRPIEDWLHAAYDPGGLRTLPMDDAIALASSRLPGKIHRDPADRILVATARLHSLTLLTRDKALLSYAKEGHLRALKI